MTYYIGKTPDVDSLLGGHPRYYYGLRRTDDGDLYFVRIDQLIGNDEISINYPGDQANNYTEFEVGIDFFEGRDVNHNLAYSNIVCEQYRWDQRAIYYYLSDEGELVAAVNQAHTYPLPKDA